MERLEGLETRGACVVCFHTQYNTVQYAIVSV